MVPTVVLNWYWHSRHRWSVRVVIGTILSEPHRQQRTPSGQRSFSSTIRQLSSVPYLSIRRGRSMSAAIGASIVKKPKKHPREMTTDELARHVFHPHVLKHAKRVIREQSAPKDP